MNFDKFLNESLSARRETVKVPELKAFFDEGEKAEWTVKGLTAAEIGRANLAAEQGQENVKALVEALAGKGDKAEAVRKAVGISDKDTPADVSRRIELLCAGSVSPEIGPERRDVVVKLAESFPTIFYDLTNKILNLTGRGAEVGKPKRSTKTRKSGE